MELRKSKLFTPRCSANSALPMNKNGMSKKEVAEHLALCLRLYVVHGLTLDLGDDSDALDIADDCKLRIDEKSNIGKIVSRNPDLKKVFEWLIEHAVPSKWAPKPHVDPAKSKKRSLLSEEMGIMFVRIIQAIVGDDFDADRQGHIFNFLMGNTMKLSDYLVKASFGDPWEHVKDIANDEGFKLEYRFEHVLLDISEPPGGTFDLRSAQEAKGYFQIMRSTVQKSISRYHRSGRHEGDFEEEDLVKSELNKSAMAYVTKLCLESDVKDRALSLLSSKPLESPAVPASEKSGTEDALVSRNTRSSSKGRKEKKVSAQSVQEASAGQMEVLK